MTKRLLALILLCASPAAAQIGVPSTAPGSSTPSSTITNGVTDTSGCVAGGVLRSISNLVDCGAGFTYASGVAGVGTASATTGALRIFNSGHAFYTEMTVSGTQGANVSYTFPDDDGTNGQVLSTNGSGVLDWIDAAGGAAAVCTSAIGTDAYACPTLTTGTCPANFAAAESVPVFMITDVANSGASTFDLCSLGAKAIVKNSPTASVATATGDMVAAYGYLLQYNATGDNFKILSIPASVGIINQANSWSGNNTYGSGVLLTQGAGYVAFGSSNTTYGALFGHTNNTPDKATFQVGSLSMSVGFIQAADIGSDFQNACTTGFGTAACTDPTVQIYSNTTDPQAALAFAHDTLGGVIAGGDGASLNGQIRIGGSVALPDTTATIVINVASANTTSAGGIISYSLNANDATNAQERTGSVRYSVATNSSGTTSCAVYGTDNAVTLNPTEANDGSGAGLFTAGAGTLTLAWTSTAGSNTCAFKIGAISSLTETTMRIDYTVTHSGRGAVTGGP